MTLNRAETKVLRVLAKADPDFGFYAFAPIARWTRLRRAVVRRACRSLGRKGLAKFQRGLCKENGNFGGSGYGITSQGRLAVTP